MNGANGDTRGSGASKQGTNVAFAKSNKKELKAEFTLQKWSELETESLVVTAVADEQRVMKGVVAGGIVGADVASDKNVNNVEVGGFVPNANTCPGFASPRTSTDHTKTAAHMFSREIASGALFLYRPDFVPLSVAKGDSIRLLITGTGRSGTEATATRLKIAGIDCPHETIGGEGSVNWSYAVQTDLAYYTGSAPDFSAYPACWLGLHSVTLLLHCCSLF
jgi:hypothetical protein